MGKIACFFGLHDWKRITEVYHGMAPGMYYGEYKKVPAQTYIQKCKNCGEEQGIIDAGFHSEVFPASYIRNQMRAYDQERQIRTTGFKIPSMTKKFEYINQVKEERARKLAERDKQVAEAAVAKYKSENNLV